MSAPQTRIVYFAYTDPAGYPPLHHSAALLANAGWDVLVLGVRVPIVESLRFPAHDRITVRYLSAWSSGWRQKIHYLIFCLWVVWWTLRSRARWVYASDALSCPAALIASFLPSVSVVYHEHDSPTESQGSASASFFSQMIALSRRWLSRRASLCILPQAQRAEWFRSSLGATAEITCVWNCPSVGEASVPARRRDDDVLRVVYHGSIVPDRVPLALAHALPHLPDNVELHVIGYAAQGHPRYVADFLQTCDALGVAQRVHYHGPMARVPLFDLSRECDIGLAFIQEGSGDINMRWMVGASNKPFDYLACSLPLLVVDSPAWRNVYVDAGYAIACDATAPESIANAVRWYLDHPAERFEMGEAGRRRIQLDWNYESQFRPVLEHLTAARHTRARRQRAHIATVS